MPLPSPPPSAESLSPELGRFAIVLAAFAAIRAVAHTEADPVGAAESAFLALLVGAVQTLAEFFVTDLAMVIVYMLMAVILAFMPRGLLGEGRFE